MRARVHRGRIRVRWDIDDPDVWLPLREQALALIGSGSVPAEDEPEISCALSVQNFKKLKSLGCKMDRSDEHTIRTIELMRVDYQKYLLESEKGFAAKSNDLETPSYEFKVKPFAHQRLGWKFLHSMKTPALFGDCGTGKTFMVLTFLESLIQAGVPTVMIVVCPVNLIRHVWAADTEKFTGLRCVSLRESSVVLVRASDYDQPGDPSDRYELARVRAERATNPEWKKKAKRKAQARRTKKIKERFQQDADIYVINYENLRTDAKEKRILDLCKRLTKEGKEILLAIDESSKVKSRTSKTYKVLKKIRRHASRCIIMTGTPSPNGILDLWAQFSLLDGGMTLQPSYIDYRHETAHEIQLRGVTWVDKQGKKHTATKWAPKPGAAKRVYKTIEPRMIRFRTDDCIDLPPVRFLIREVDMNQEQSEVYTDMENMLFAEIEGEPVTAKIAASKLLKLREITGGFVITDSREEVPLGKDSPKMLELDALLEQSVGPKLGDDRPSKALVWANYQWECKTLVKRYQRKYGARGLFGGISSKAKDESISRFMNSRDCRLLVCHPGSVGHGLTLTEANYAFYYSLSYNYEEFYQSYRRITRPGQTRSMTYYFLVCPNTIDENLLEVLREKKNLSEIVTDGRFSRDGLLAARKKTNQIDINWEIPHETATEGGQ